MSVESKLTIIDTSLSNIKTAITNKGITPSGDITTYATAIGNISALNGTTLNVTPTTSAQNLTPTSPYNGYTTVNVSAVTSSIDQNITAGNIKDGVQILGVTGNYQGSDSEYQLQRVIDDNNNEIGTAFMKFTDANNNKYKVVCLDAQYRVKGNYYFCSSMTAITNMPITDDITNGFWGTLPYTATENTQLILDYCTANNYTSTACTHCRSLSFTIGGTTYYGQFPNMIEVVEMWKRPSTIESMDTSASSYTDVNFSTKRNMIVSTQSTAQNCWLFGSIGSISEVPKSLTGQLVIPVLEIPVS